MCIRDSPQDFECESCIQAKLTRVPLPKTVSCRERERTWQADIYQCMGTGVHSIPPQAALFELRWSHRPIFVVRSNRSLRPCLVGASSPKITPCLIWGLGGASTMPRLAPSPPPPPATTTRTPSLTTATTRIAFPMRTALPALRVPTCTDHIPHVPPTSCAPHPHLDPALARTLSRLQQ
jgi:hypothetical protein